MLHLDIRRDMQEQGVRDWFAVQVQTSKRFFRKGQREFAMGIHHVLQEMVINGNLHGTDTGEQMESTCDTLWDYMESVVDRELERRLKEASERKII